MIVDNCLIVSLKSTEQDKAENPELSDGFWSGMNSVTAFSLDSPYHGMVQFAWNDFARHNVGPAIGSREWSIKLAEVHAARSQAAKDTLNDLQEVLDIMRGM